MLYGYTCILTMAVHIGRGGCTKETLKDSLCTFVLIPFFPIILPLFMPYHYYCEARAERNIIEHRSRNDNRSGYDGFQQSTNNEVKNNEDN